MQIVNAERYPFVNGVLVLGVQAVQLLADLHDVGQYAQTVGRLFVARRVVVASAGEGSGAVITDAEL
jgi:hypothetical protein